MARPGPQRFDVPITTATGGGATEYTLYFSGPIHSVTYTKAASASFTDGVDFALTLEATGEAVWTGTNVNSSVTVYPVAAATLTGGTASTITERPIVAGNDRVKVVVTSGGDAKTGTITVIAG